MVGGHGTSGGASSAGGGAPLLAVEGLDAGYGDVQVLWGVTLSVNRGEAVALIGSNGAGKTTLLRAISGTIPARGGRLTFEGEDITGLQPDRRVARGLAHVPEGRQVFNGMTVRENLRMGAYTRRDARDEVRADLDRVLALFPALAERQTQLAGTLSGGEQQMVAIGRGLMGRPELLLIDELSLGLAPVVVERLMAAVREVHSAGTTILLVEQDVQAALEIAGRGYVIAHGRVALQGSSEGLLRSEEIRSAYLGI